MAQSPKRWRLLLPLALLLGTAGCVGPHPIPPDFSDDRGGNATGGPEAAGDGDAFGGGSGGVQAPPVVADGGLVADGAHLDDAGLDAGVE